MESYANGGGHRDLAENLGIEKYFSLAIGGSANSRILRTTLKHSYQTNEPTFYVLGMTFIGRTEIPILKYAPDEMEDSSFEGRWTNPQNQKFANRWEHFWTEKDTEKFVDIRLKAESYSLIDRTEDLMYQMLAAISDLTGRGHAVLLYQQADSSILLPKYPNQPDRFIDSDRLKLLASKSNIVDGFKWQAIQWQHQQGVPEMPNGNWKSVYGDAPPEIRHRAAGHHHQLNEYLINYVKQYKILE
jgi:hypothetical protein